MTGRAVTRAALLAWVVRLLTVAGLGTDAGIHLYLAPTRPPGSPGEWSQVALFYAEGAVSILAAVVVLATGARLAYAFAFLVAASALGAVVLYRYVDVGALGPLPNMYEPYWYFGKTSTAVAEAVAVLTAAGGTLLRSNAGTSWTAHSRGRTSLAPR